MNTNKGTKKEDTIKKEDGKIQLELVHGFGSLGHSGLKNGFTFVEDDGIKLGFPIGKHFALKTIDRAEMNFIGLHDNLEEITSICVSKNRKYFAVSGRMRGENYPQMSIYTIKGGEDREKEKTFQYMESKSNAFVNMCYSEDPRFLVMLTGYEDSQLVFLDTSRMKPMGTTTLNGKGMRVSINPRDNHIVAVSGEKIFKVLRVQENTFKYLGDIVNLNTNQNFTEHAWADEHKLLIANDQATIYIVYNFQVAQVLNNCFNLSEKDPQTSVTALVTFSRGFAIGGDNGTFSIWIKNEDIDPEKGQKNFFSFLRTRKGPEGLSESLKKKAGIISLDVSPTEDLIAVCFRNNDLATISMSQLVPSNADVVDPHKLKKLLERDIQFDYLYNGFHNGAITSLDICVQRPLIATCSNEDSTIRIWNYMNYRCELAVMFSVREDHKGEITPLLSLSFHPSGYYLAVGFEDRLEIFHICSEELRSYRILTQLKCVRNVKFSNFGHMLAAVYPRTNHSNYYINIYDAFTLEQIAIPIKGPADAVRELIWTNNDETLVCYSNDGTIYEWNVRQDFLNRKEYVNIKEHSEIKLSDITYMSNGWIVGCGTYKGRPVLKEFKMKEDVQKATALDCEKLDHIVGYRGYYDTLALIGSTKQGSLTVFRGGYDSQPYEYKSAHLKEVVKMIVSPDGKYVFSAGKDQCILIFQVKEILDEGFLVTKSANVKDGEENRNFNPYALAVDENLADVVLVPQAEIDKFRSEIRQLRLEIEDLQDKIEFTAEEDRRRIEREREAAEENMNVTIKGWQRRCEELRREKVALEKEYENLLKLTEENHLRAIDELEELYEKKLAFENEKYLQIEQELVEETNKQARKEKRRQLQHHDKIDGLEGQFKGEFSKTHKIFETNKNTADQIKSEYEAKLIEIEEEHEAEVRELTLQHKKELDKLDQEINQLTEDNTEFKQEKEEAKIEREKLKKSEEEKATEARNLKNKLNDTRQTIETLKKSLEERKQSVLEKKSAIAKYKTKITDLQKSKHVLSYRTTEMRKNLEPKEVQIEKLKDELFHLEKEFEIILKDSQAENDRLIKKDKKIEAIQSELNAKATSSAKKEHIIQQIKLDIYNAIRTKEPKEYANEMRKLYRTYCAESEIKESHSNDPRSIGEMVKQIQYLEKSIFQMNRGTEKTVKRREQEIHRKILENSDLICDLNALRKTNKQLESDIYKLGDDNETLRKERKILIDERNAIKIELAEFNKTAVQNQNILAKLAANDKPNQMPSLLKSKSDQIKPFEPKIAKLGIENIKNQFVEDKNKLVELLGELDICNQRLMQQEMEFNHLLEQLQKHGVEDDMMESQYSGQFMKTHKTETQYSEVSGRADRGTEDQLNGLKSSLHVKSTLVKMSQNN